MNTANKASITVNVNTVSYSLITSVQSINLTATATNNSVSLQRYHSEYNISQKLGLDRYHYSVSVSGQYQRYRSSIGIAEAVSDRNCLKFKYTNNTLFCFSLYNSLTIIVQIAPVVLLIINFASDVHMSMFEYLAVKIRFLPV